MISSMTGSYVGYSFAVPSNITRKIIEDIMEYGNVQRGILGVEGGELNSAVSKELGINRSSGFYVNGVTKNSGAEKAGLKKGDIIIKLDETSVTSFADLSGVVNSKRPNDVIKVTYVRDGKSWVVPVTLTKNEFSSYSFNGMQLEDISPADAKKFNLNYGVKIKEVENDYNDFLKGSIILKIDNEKVENVESASEILTKKQENRAMKIELINRNGQLERYILQTR